MKFNPKKLVRDPFVLLIALVIIVPALLVIVAAQAQNKPQSTAVNSAISEVKPNQSQPTSSANQNNQAAKPITEAEQPHNQAQAPASATLTPAPAPPPAPVCDEGKKQAAQGNYNNQLASENNQHEQKLNQLRLVSMVTRKYWDEEMARHQAAVNQIESNYRAALTAANC